MQRIVACIMSLVLLRAKAADYKMPSIIEYRIFVEQFSIMLINDWKQIKSKGWRFDDLLYLGKVAKVNLEVNLGNN